MWTILDGRPAARATELSTLDLAGAGWPSGTG
jgi:hypothetical protein